MAYYALFYDADADMAVRRQPFRAVHLDLVGAAHTRGDIVMAGALGDPPAGALLIFRGEGPEVAEKFAAADPYVTNGVITRWRVVPWTVVAGPER